MPSLISTPLVLYPPPPPSLPPSPPRIYTDLTSDPCIRRRKVKKKTLSLVSFPADTIEDITTPIQLKILPMMDNFILNLQSSLPLFWLQSCLPLFYLQSGFFHFHFQACLFQVFLASIIYHLYLLVIGQLSVILVINFSNFPRCVQTEGWQ